MLCVFSEWICMKGRSGFLKHNWLSIIMAVAATTLLVGVFAHTLSFTDIVPNCYTHYCQSHSNGTTVQVSLYHLDPTHQSLLCKVFGLILWQQYCQL